MKRTTVLLSDEMDARLKHEARRRGVRISDVVREAVELHLGRRRLRSLGAGASGRSDISERIEELLVAESDPPCS
jgi:Arc/MetJ-type ribon-helix-helix transcriptional regulator